VTTDAIASGAELARLPFRSAISEDSIAAIVLTNSVFNADFKGCLPLSPTGDTLWVTVPSLCGAPTLREFMATGSPFNLESIVPNPAVDGATISFSLAAPEMVSISVSDFAGRESLVAAPAEMERGEHRVSWDARGLPTGVYACRIQVGSESVVRKIVVLH
jgi:hypothetical protein